MAFGTQELLVLSSKLDLLKLVAGLDRGRLATSREKNLVQVGTRTIQMRALRLNSD